jgi:hypothetical protein
MNTMT